MKSTPIREFTFRMEAMETKATRMNHKLFELLKLRENLEYFKNTADCVHDEIFTDIKKISERHNSFKEVNDILKEELKQFETSLRNSQEEIEEMQKDIISNRSTPLSLLSATVDTVDSSNSPFVIFFTQ